MLARTRHWLLLAPVLFTSLAASPCLGQTYKKGDEIEVYYLGSWLPATVINASPRGEVVAEFTFIQQAKRDVFKLDAVRAAYESDAIARGRTWTDSSGAFKVKAALLKITDSEILLRKPDLTEVKIAQNKLCDADKTFLKNLQKSMGLIDLAGPEPPPVEIFTHNPRFGDSASYGVSSTRAALVADPVPAYLKLKQAGCGFPAEQSGDRVGAVLPVGGPDQWLLATIESFAPLTETPTRLVWVSLARQKVEQRHLLPAGEMLLDYHPPSRRALTYNSGFPVSASTLALWETNPKEDKPKPIVRWRVDVSPGETRWHPWGRLIDGNLVLHQTEKHKYIAWDIQTKTSRYEILQESFRGGAPGLSGGRKYLLIPEENGVRFLEAASGNWVMNLGTPEECFAAAISDDGRQAAALGRNTVSVWDLTAADVPPTVFQTEGIQEGWHPKLAWLGNERLMADTSSGQSLFSLKSKMTLWNYEFELSADSLLHGARVREIVDQHLVYAASAHGWPSMLAVGAVRLPGPGVDEMEARLDRELLYCIKPGSAVRLDVRAGEFTEQVTRALEAKAIQNDWVVDSKASITLAAEMKRGDMQTVNYHFPAAGASESKQSATFVPYISWLKLLVGDETAWIDGRGSGAPGHVRLKPGQSIQDEVDRWQKPQVEFFETVKIPSRIIHPKHRNGLGTTTVGNRGLVPRANKP